MEICLRHSDGSELAKTDNLTFVHRPHNTNNFHCRFLLRYETRAADDPTDTVLRWLPIYHFTTTVELLPRYDV